MHVMYIRSRLYVECKNCSSPLLHFELSPLNELYRGKFVRSITLIPFEMFDDNWYTYISGQEAVSRARMVAPPCCPFELSPLNLLKSGKLVHSITLIPFNNSPRARFGI